MEMKKRERRICSRRYSPSGAYFFSRISANNNSRLFRDHASYQGRGPNRKHSCGQQYPSTNPRHSHVIYVPTSRNEDRMWEDAAVIPDFSFLYLSVSRLPYILRTSRPVKNNNCTQFEDHPEVVFAVPAVLVSDFAGTASKYLWRKRIEQLYVAPAYIAPVQQQPCIEATRGYCGQPARLTYQMVRGGVKSSLL